MDIPAFRKHLEEVFSPEGAAKILSALECPPSVSVRLNPAKWRDAGGGAEEIAGKKVSGRVPWCGQGRFLDERPLFTLDPALHSGAYYVQDSSSMFVGFVFRQMLGRTFGRAEDKADKRAGWEAEGGAPATRRRPVRVLDLCAAPGGKTTDLAASLREALGDGFILVSNEVMKNRAGTLADNVALWGDPNVAVTSADPAAFAALGGFFDIILTDVPCSGEGMFRKDEGAAEQWSEETVTLCAARQRRILADVWPALAPGGLLIYSTCTFNRTENDGNVEWIAGKLGAEVQEIDCPFEGPVRTEHGFSLAPGHVRGEGQYCAALKKTNGGITHVPSRDESHVSSVNRLNGASLAAAASLKGFAEMFSVPVSFRERNGLTVAVPQSIWAELAAVERCLKPIAAGVAAGTMKAGGLIPSADLALTTILREGAFPDAPLDRETALKFLHRDSIRLGGVPLGYVTVSYEGRRLGFVKNIGQRCNNLHPMSRRILMDIR